MKTDRSPREKTDAGRTRRSTPLSLNAKAVLTVFGLIFIAITTNTLVLNTITAPRYKSALVGKAEAIGKSLQHDIEHALLLGLGLTEMPGLAEKLDEVVADHSTIDYALITDAQGEILFHNASLHGGTDHDSETALPIDNGVPENGLQVLEKQDHYEVILNIDTESPGPPPALRIGLARSAVTTELAHLTRWAVGTAGAVLTVSLFFVIVLISRVVTNPVLEMKKAAEQIAAGNLSTQFTYGGRDEIGALGKAISQTAENLSELLSGVKGTAGKVTDVAQGVKTTARAVRTVADSQGKSMEEAALSIEAMDRDIASIATGLDGLAISATETSQSMEAMSAALENIAEAVDSSEERSAETAVSVQEMVRNVDSISENIGYLSQSFGEIIVSVNELDAMVNEIKTRAEESVTLAEEVDRNASEKGQQAVESAREGMENVREVMESTTQAVRNLGDRSDDIGQILDVIRSVTDQTGLLSLNAAILAAQAGEHGKAFSVVASEIGNLAEKTAASTTSIEDIVKALRTDIADSIDKSARGIEQVENGMKRVDDVRAAFDDIVTSSRQATNMARAIEHATSEQAGSTRAIQSAIEEMRETQLRHIVMATEEQGQGGRLVVEANEDFKGMLAQIRASTTTQRASGRQIADAMQRVSKEVDGIAQATTGLRDRSRDVVRFTNSVLSATGELLSSADTMGNAVSVLEGETDTLQKTLARVEVDPAEKTF